MGTPFMHEIGYSFDVVGVFCFKNGIPFRIRVLFFAKA